MIEEWRSLQIPLVDSIGLNLFFAAVTKVLEENLKFLTD